jgi:hypothetical protein
MGHLSPLSRARPIRSTPGLLSPAAIPSFDPALRTVEATHEQDHGCCGTRRGAPSCKGACGRSRGERSPWCGLGRSCLRASRGCGRRLDRIHRRPGDRAFVGPQSPGAIACSTARVNEDEVCSGRVSPQRWPCGSVAAGAAGTAAEPCGCPRPGACTRCRDTASTGVRVKASAGQEWRGLRPHGGGPALQRLHRHFAELHDACAVLQREGPFLE